MEAEIQNFDQRKMKATKEFGRSMFFAVVSFCFARVFRMIHVYFKDSRIPNKWTSRLVQMNFMFFFFGFYFYFSILCIDFLFRCSYWKIGSPEPIRKSHRALLKAKLECCRARLCRSSVCWNIIIHVIHVRLIYLIVS